MAAEVSCWMKNKSEIPITRDLLGQFSLDLSASHSQTEILYKKRCKSLSSPENNSKQGEVRDIGGCCNRKRSSEEEESCVPALELKLPLPNSTHYSQTVVCCTSLDTVKSALERAAQTNNLHTRNAKKNPPEEEEEDEMGGSRQLKRRKLLPSSTCGMFATRCRSCFMNVITLKADPICPHCNLTIPHPDIPKTKRPWIDLNQSLSPST